MASIPSSRLSQIQANQAWHINHETRKAANSSPSGDGLPRASKEPWANYPPFLRWPWVLILTLGFSLFLLALTGCGGSAATVTVIINVPSVTTIDPGQSVNLTVTLTNDSSNQGVQWTVTCTAGACGTLSGNTTSSVIYTAPSTVPVQFTVTITATSIANSKDSQTLNLTVVANPSITTPAGPLAPGMVGTVYSLTLTETGGVAPYSWSISNGMLPAGLTLNSTTGAISGTPTAAGTSNFTVTLTDSGSPALTTSVNFSIAVSPAPAITFTTASLPAGTVGAAYTSSVAATGGAGKLTYAVTFGALPAGLSLSSSGAISGTPTSAGKSSFTVTATDAYSDSGKASLSITISAAPAITFTTTTLPAGAVGTAYTSSVGATGGAGALTYAITSGALPAGVSLSAGGAISGTPASAGKSSFTVTATDAYSDSGKANLSITISAAPAITFTTTSLPEGVVGTGYSATIMATGGAGTLTYAVTSGALPTGLSLSSVGAITGTPTSAGTGNFTVTASDAYGDSGKTNLSIIIAAALSVTTASLPNGTLGTAYGVAVAASGGAAPYTWSISSGSLPAGLTLASGTGAISGTPTATGMSSFTIKVTDSESTPASATASLSITVNPAQLAITTMSLPAGTLNVGYSQTLAASGGTAPYTWSVSMGSLPAGLSLAASTGIISGTPTATGASNFTVQVKDSESTPQTKTANLTITINPAALSITSTTLPVGTEGTSYTTTLLVTGGTAPYTWSISNGSLPAGLSLAASTGIVSGTPTATGASNFSVQVKDSESTPQTKTANLTITINPPPLTITSTVLPTGTVGILYTTTLSASGGTAPYTWSISSGSLPAGLTLAASTGSISGTPTATGPSSFTIKVTDSETTPASATANLSITVNPAQLAITTSSLPAGTLNVGYSQALAAGGGSAPYTWSVSMGSLPAGLSLAASTGVISGTPTATGASNFTVQVKDSEATPQTKTANLSITINPPPLSITTTVFPVGTVGTAYTTTLSASGGTAPYSWSVASGLLPAGLTLDASTGVISGTPTQSRAYTLSIQVQDSESTPQRASTAVEISVYSGMEITTRSLARAQLGTSYDQGFAAADGYGNYNWSLISGTLPPGLTFSGPAAAITGTPTQAGTYLFQVQVADSESTPTVLTANYSITVIASYPLTLPRPNLNDANVGASYEEDSLQELGQGIVIGTPLAGTPPYTFNVLNGAMPPGITFASAGIFSGTPTDPGFYPFTVQVVDANNNTATAPSAITVYPQALTIENMFLAAGNVGTKYNGVALSATGGTAPYTITMTSGSLPPGLSYSDSSDQITGIPSTAGSYNVTFQATDSASHTTSQAYTIKVSQDPPCPTGSESELNGSYAFELRGFSGYGIGYPEAAVFSFTADGSGGVTRAEGDVNVSTGSGSQSMTFTSASTYTVGSSGLGCLNLVTASGANMTFAFTLGGVSSSVATRGRIINFNSAALGQDLLGDYSAPGSRPLLLSGELAQQTSSDFSLGGLAANFAFGIAGSDSQLGHFALTGSLTNSSTGSFSGVFADSNDNGVVQSALSGGTGGFTGTPDAQGRLHASIAVGGKTYNYVAYIVNDSEVYLVSSDAIDTNPIASGILTAGESSYSESSLAGNYIFVGVGSDSSCSANTFLNVGLLSFTSGASWNGTEYPYESGCATPNGAGGAAAVSGTYALSAVSGRLELTQSGGNAPVIYLTGSSSGIAGFLVDTTAGSGSPAIEGEMFAQPNVTYSDASLSGNFVLSEGGYLGSNQEVPYVGPITIDNGLASIALDGSSGLVAAGAKAAQGSISVNANGTGRLVTTDNTNILVTNGSVAYAIDFSNNATILVFEQQ